MPSVSSRFAPEISMNQVAAAQVAAPSASAAIQPAWTYGSASRRPGLGREGEDRRQDEDRLESFAQQDQERAREGGGRRQVAGTQRPFGGGEEGVDRAHLVRDRGGRIAALDRRAQLEHAPLDLAREPGVGVREARLGQLESLEIAPDRRVARRRPVALRVVASGPRRASRA